MKVVPLDYTNGLLYWRNCQDANLTRAVRRLIVLDPLTAEDLELIKSYFLHWVQAPFNTFECESTREILARKIAEATDVNQLEEVLDSLVYEGIDPI